MHRLRIISAFAALALATLILSGCAGKTVQERGWIGGEFRDVREGFFKPDPLNGDPTLPALPPEVRTDRDRAVLVTGASADSPLGRSGARPGDLLLALDAAPLSTAVALREAAGERTPGETVSLTLLRQGQTITLPVTVGRERFERRGYLSLGLRLNSKIEFGLQPNFDLLGLVSYRRNESPLELSGPEGAYLKTLAGPDHPLDVPRWEIWLGVLGLGRTERIWSQDLAESGPAEANSSQGEHHDRE